MIKDNMFYGDPTLKEYRDMDVPAIIREFLLSKGTWKHNLDGTPAPAHQEVTPKALVDSGLFVYGLKKNATNCRAVEYYCERWAQMNQVMWRDRIRIPIDLWSECDGKNREFTKNPNREKRL